MRNGLDAVSFRKQLLLLLATLSACGPMPETGEPDGVESQPQALDADNGLSLNGLSLNGLSLNGLSLNGLSPDGLSTSQFNDWFQQNPTLNDMVMRYVVRCAVPDTEVRTYTSPATGQSYSWAGSLGLAPGWSQGSPATLTEQRLVSGCLAAHANKYGVHIAISVQGLRATGEPVPTSAQELQTYSEKEGCFFGNVFNSSEGIYVGNDGHPLNYNESTPRACALNTKWSTSQECRPMQRVDSRCSDLCTRDATGSFYVSCTYNGITYPAITTRMLPSDIYVCGDGTCQISEQCGTAGFWNNCLRDCGLCL